MRIIKDCEFKEECLICNKNTKGDAILIGIYGTQEGYNMEAKLFHVNCLNLIYYPEQKMIVQKI